jgi:GxxExxY protein
MNADREGQRRYRHSQITERTIGAAFAVHNTLGRGSLEKVYENALVLERVKAGVSVEQQVPTKVLYDGQVIGDYVADLVVEGKALVEVKPTAKLEASHEAQVINYLKATGLAVGLLLNFARKAEVKGLVFDG